MSDKETRTISLEGVELRSDEGQAVIEGYAAVFNQATNLGQFDEVIAPGAFRRTLASGPDVRATIEHEGGLTTIGRTRNNTLLMSEDGHGLRVKIFPPDTQAARDALTLIRGGFVNQMSFAFRVPKGGDEWQAGKDGRSLRTLKEVDLHDGDVAVVSYPAYPTTSVEARAMAEQLAGGTVDGAGREEGDAGAARARVAAMRRTIQIIEVKR